MYTKKQKAEIYTIFLLILLVVEIFNFFIARKGLLQIYEQGHNFPWTTLPIHWLFPIWTTLYVTIAIAGAKVYIQRKSHIRSFAMAAWVVQLILNILWPLCFYYVPIEVITPILVTILFMTMVTFMFYGYLLDKRIVLYALPFFLMIMYKLILHWVFYILNLETILHLN